MKTLKELRAERAALVKKSRQDHRGLCLCQFFYPGERGRREIISLSREVFNGRYDAELYAEYGHWLPYITDIYMPICDSDSGDFRTLPFHGGVFDQPYMTMQVLKVIQMEYRKHLNEKIKNLRK